jgi:hypothetical protein
MAKEGLHLNLYKVPGAEGVWRCDIKLNTSRHGEGLTFRGTSEPEDSAVVMGSWLSKLSKPLRALSKARVVAQAILSNPAIASAFPQYVAPALAALAAMEAAEKKGKLSTVKKQLTDPTLKKLARELDEMSKGQRSAMSGGGICLACANPPRRLGNDAAPHQRHGDEHTHEKGPFGLPSGNPHPWAQYVKQQIVRGQFRDPITLQKLARMQAYQRGMARASR